MAKPSRRKRPSVKDEDIDVHELAGMSNMDGMLSFLNTKPEDYAKLFAQAGAASTSLPLLIEDKDTKVVQPDSNLPPDPRLLPGGTLPPDSSLHPDSTLRSDGNLMPGSKLQAESSLPPVSKVPAGLSLLPGVNLPPESNPPPGGDLPNEPEASRPGSSLRPDSNLLTDRLGSDQFEPEDSPRPESNLLPDSDLLAATSRAFAREELVTPNGRIVRVRLARSVQDAHSTGEHLLLQAMWKKGTPETPDTRLLQAGLSDLARWTGAHKTRCRAHLRALVHKLALEETKSFNAAAGKEGSRAFRIYSFNAILERRRQANLTHVIRTGAVIFVDPKTGHRLLPGSNLRRRQTRELL
jgi:hypothetical protein